jgi:hypothetical protein
LGAIAELTNDGATTWTSLSGSLRIAASRAAKLTAASDETDPSIPTTISDRVASLDMRPPDT